MIHHERIIRNFFRSAVQMCVDDLLDHYCDEPLDPKARRTIGQHVVQAVEDRLHWAVLSELEEYKEERSVRSHPSPSRECEVISLAEIRKGR